ncbi:MAG TPA: Ldh family oxidoreductase [Chloroflexaceae bacterium]|nr:Ldh family oxidoreductase [Chloroflexaceae bacterium]
MTTPTLFAADELLGYAAALLAASGLPADDAALVAAIVVQADLDGVETHGLGRLANYLERLRRGVVNPRPQMRLARERGATAVLDADNGMGQLAAARAMDEAVRLARAAGIGWVAVRRSNHCGAMSYYVNKAVEAGMIGLALTNSPPGMAPYGGREAFLGTNPIGVGIPVAGGDPIVLDMATSAVARGQIIKAERAGRPIPPGVAVDAAGAPTTDAAAALKGALLPMAGAKGYGLALAVELLCGAMSGAAMATEMPSFFDNWEQPSNVGHVLAAIDVAAFGDPEEFGARAAGLAAGLRAVPPAEGHRGVMVPGERRAALARERRSRGVPVPATTLALLAPHAERLGVAQPAAGAEQG